MLRIKLFIEVENSMVTLNGEQKMKIRFQFQKHLNTIRDKKGNNNEHINFRKCTKFLKTNKDILITNADKGNITVLVNENDYEQKINSLLQDNDT